MWYEMKRTFINAAARVMWASAWADERERLIEQFRSGELSMDWPDQTPEEYVRERGWPHSMQGVECCDAAPPTPDYARLEAAMLLSRLEERNGAGLAAIVRAARTADCVAAVDSGVKHDHGNYLNQHDTPSGDACLPLDVEEFASDVAMMALGTGVSWFDDHERFDVLGNAFSVPSVEFTYEEGEE